MSVQVQKLTKIYGLQHAVDQISFEAPTGMITGFLGPNGAGKSTTMKIATGYLLPSSGEVFVEGIPVSTNAINVKKTVGYLPEHNPMYLDMYVREFLNFIGKAYQMKSSVIKLRIAEMVELCGLKEEQHKKLGTLSKGYRQRVGLAKALFANPKVLILDEPTSGLDPNQIQEIREVIRNISVQKTVIFSTHIMQEVEALCDKVVIINSGKVVADESLIDLKKKSSSSFQLEVTFESAINVEVFKNLGEINKRSDTTYLITSSSKKLRKEILEITSKNDLPLISIKEVGGSLEEIFQALTKKGEMS